MGLRNGKENGVVGGLRAAIEDAKPAAGIDGRRSYGLEQVALGDMMRAGTGYEDTA